jgi:hypothetical protein
MRKALIVWCACVTLIATPDAAWAWGYTGHRLIMRRAIELLPPELKPLFERYRDEIIVRVVDPDQWRLVGWDEDPNHFLDFGVAEYGKPPFAALPRDYGQALQKFGAVVLKRNGLLPWREAEMFGTLQRSFAELPRNAPYTVSNLVLFAPIVAHYVQDAFQPFHATDNFDGRMTGNDGIHARFERDLIEKFESRLTLTPPRVTAITNPRDAAFDTLIQSYATVDAILEADRQAIAGKDAYDAAYFEAFFTKVQPILERQLSDAISATASVIVGAWEQAGRPAIRLDDARPLQRVRPPRP